MTAPIPPAPDRDEGTVEWAVMCADGQITCRQSNSEDHALTRSSNPGWKRLHEQCGPHHVIYRTISPWKEPDA